MLSYVYVIFITYIISHDRPLIEVTGTHIKTFCTYSSQKYNIITLHPHNKKMFQYILFTLLHVSVESCGVRYNRQPDSPRPNSPHVRVGHTPIVVHVIMIMTHTHCDTGLTLGSRIFWCANLKIFLPNVFLPNNLYAQSHSEM